MEVLFMNKSEVLEKVQNIISESIDIDVEKIIPEATLTDDLEIDSLELVDLTMNFESDLGVTIEDSELEGIKTVGDIVNLIEKKLG
jgi:acyl carrier protein